MERRARNVCLEFQDGRIGYHFGTWGARGSRLRYTFHAHCDEGMLEADMGKQLVYTVEASDKSSIIIEFTGKHTENEMGHFLDCIERDETPITNGPAALKSLRTIWRLYQADGKAAWADLSDL